MNDLDMVLNIGFFALPGPGFLIFGVWRLYKELRVKFWPRVSARIVESRVDKVATARGYECIPIIFFEYTLNGVRYCTQADLFSTGSEANAISIKSKYHFDKSVLARVNPKNPNMANLESNVTIVPALFIVLGFFFIIGAIMVLRSP
jgi:hypothetical protein